MSLDPRKYSAGPLAAYVHAAIDVNNPGHDGLLQRLQLLVWPDEPATWRRVDRAPDLRAKKRAYAALRGLANLTAEQCGAKTIDVDRLAIPALRFTARAQEVFNVWRDDLEERLRAADLAPAVAEHLGKYRSLMPTLALLIHLMDLAVGRKSSGNGVGTDAAVQAVEWCRYLDSHAKRLYSSAINPALEGARPAEAVALRAGG